MVDSSKWDVIEAGLRCLQGKGIINSGDLHEGGRRGVQEARQAGQGFMALPPW